MTNSLSTRFELADRRPQQTAEWPLDKPKARAGARWGAVWCCSDMPVSPETLFGLHSGEILVIQGCSTMLTDSVLAGVWYATLQHGVSQLLVLAHAGCKLLEAHLAQGNGSTPFGDRLSRAGLFCGMGADDVSRALAVDGARQLRRRMAGASQLILQPAFLDGAGAVRIVPTADG